ncbi:MAG TPA: hypothetical protein VKA09_11970, partial [Nitrososphaeraceae archaeon]|nr:hypothetical protein [Nitrososphaeraceae archaeon]
GAVLSYHFSAVYSNRNNSLSPIGTKRDCGRTRSAHFQANIRNGEISWAKRKRADFRRRVSEAQDRVTDKIVKMDVDSDNTIPK